MSFYSRIKTLLVSNLHQKKDSFCLWPPEERIHAADPPIHCNTREKNSNYKARSAESLIEMEPVYDRRSELKAFDESKAGVKGLVDAGVAKIPRIFIHAEQHQQYYDNSGSSSDPKFSIPIIDFQGINGDANLRAKVVNEVRVACENWGFFQAVNHGVEICVLDEMIDGVRRFHEQDHQVKSEFYTKREQLIGGIPCTVIWFLHHPTLTNCPNLAGIAFPVLILFIVSEK